jgi:O-antigen ligase
MDETLKASLPLIETADVVAGEKSSRLSAGIVFLVWLVPVFSTILFGGVDTITWVMISVFWLAIIFLWLGETWKGNGLLINPSSLQLPILGLLLIGLIQLLPLGGAIDSGGLGAAASRSLTMDAYATRFFLIHLAVYAVFLAACLTFVNTEARLKKTAVLIIIFGAVMAFFGIMQRLANPDGIYGLRGTPQAVPFGPFVNQHHFASFMVMTAGLALALLFSKRSGRNTKVLLAAAVVIMGIAIVFTSSRGGVLAFISVLAFVTMLNFFSGRWSDDKSVEESGKETQRKIVLIAAAGSLVLVILGSVLLLGGNESLFRGIGVTQIQDGVSNGRAHFWSIALKIFLEHPILGAGLEAFGVAFTKHDTWNGLFRVEQAHNEYLQTLADAGIVGFACVVAFIYLLFKKGLRTIASARGFRRDAAIGALAGCFGILIHSFFDFPLRTPSNAFFFLMLCAIATVPVQSPHSEHSRRRRRSNAP